MGCRFAIGRAACGVCALILLSAVWLVAGSAVAAAATVQKQGYIPMADGTQLAYTVELPAGHRPVSRGAGVRRILRGQRRAVQ